MAAAGSQMSSQQQAAQLVAEISTAVTGLAQIAASSGKRDSLGESQKSNSSQER